MAIPGARLHDDTAQVAAGERRPTRSPFAAGLTPWLVTLVLAAGSGVAGFYAFEHYRLTTDENEVLRGQVAEAIARAAASDERALELTADLSRARGEFTATSTIAFTKTAEAQALESKLREALDKVGEVTASVNQEISLQLVDKVLFRLGDDQLTEKGQKVLEKLGALLKDVPDRQIWVQGHTDDTPIKESSERFQSNWELSAARALTVVHYLEESAGVDPRRLAAVAFGQNRPVSKSNRPRNRRIEIVLYPPSLPVSKGPIRAVDESEKVESAKADDKASRPADGKPVDDKLADDKLADDKPAAPKSAPDGAPTAARTARP